MNTQTQDSISGFVGTTCYVNNERGVVTGFTYFLDKTSGAFISLSERSAMIFVTLQVSSTEKYAYDVVQSKEITRDDFDALAGIDKLRQDCGWAIA
jgi:hypothetical protein